MSSDNLPSKKVTWRTHLSTTENIYQLIKDEARREDRSIANVVSRIIKYYFEEKNKTKVLK